MQDIFSFLTNDYKEEYENILTLNQNVDGSEFLPTLKRLLETSFRKLIEKNEALSSALQNKELKEILFNNDFSNFILSTLKYDLTIFRDSLFDDKLDSTSYEMLYYEVYLYLKAVYEYEKGKKLKNNFDKNYYKDLVNKKNEDNAILALISATNSLKENSDEYKTKLNELISLLIEKQRYEEAEEHIKKLISLNKKDYTAYWQLCLAQVKCSTIDEVKCLSEDIDKNINFKHAVEIAKSEGDTAFYKKLLSFRDAQFGYRTQQKKEKEKTKRLIITACVLFAIIILNITLPIVLNKINYNKRQKLYFNEYATGVAVYVLEGFEQEEVVVPQTYKGKNVVRVTGFKNNKVIKKITLPGTITTIDSYAFNECFALEEIVFTSLPTIHDIGVKAFSGCVLLQEFNADLSNLNTLGQEAFNGCEKLKEIDLSSSNLEQISNATFSRCLSLENITLGENITKIGEAAFFGCKNFTSISIPNKVKSIESTAFTACTNLETLIIDKNNSLLETIGADAFNGCAIKNLTLPNSIKKINFRAFKNNKLESLTLPSSLTLVNSGAFSENKLLTLDIFVSDPQVFAAPFIETFAYKVDNSENNYIQTELKVYVPDDSFDAYRAVWNIGGLYEKIFKQSEKTGGANE